MIDFNFYWIADIIRKTYPDREINEHIHYIRQYNRWIQISTPIDDNCIHYELSSQHLSLHFEYSSSVGGYQAHMALVDYLSHLTEKDARFRWRELSNGYGCDNAQPINSTEELMSVLKEFVDYFDNAINDYFLQQTPSIQRIEIEQENSIFKEDVSIQTKSLLDIYKMNLHIPVYQRIYCWAEDNVRCLLEDLELHIEKKSNNVPYRLGTIILHSHENCYDIIDGQQRLVTIALLLQNLGVITGLIQEKFSSSEAKQYIAYNKSLIANYVQKYIADKGKFIQFILNQVELDVLMLHNSSLDLAYTFFSNENSRGVSLTDYDLLKAHHLRFIPATYEQQAQKAAATWNAMIERGREQITDYDTLPDYAHTLDTFIFQLRHWMRKQNIDISPLDRHIKREYEAAPIMLELPPFGETFYFNEPIQGGTHFFTFVEHHLSLYRQFIGTKEYIALNNGLNEWGSCRWYKETISAILFAYYEKFGQYCLADAMVLIMRIMLEHRYSISRANRNAVAEYASEKGLVLMLDQATSPTFFIAEVYNLCREFPKRMQQELRPIQIRMRQYVNCINEQMEQYIYVNSIKNILS